jgi:hypothetical protein
MVPTKRVELPTSAVLDAGVVVATGELLGDRQDGLQFIYLSNSADPEKPLIAMTAEVASLALAYLSIAIKELTQGNDNEVLHERLSLIKDLATEVAEIIVGED